MNQTDIKELRREYGEKRVIRVEHLNARMPDWMIWTGIVLAVIAVLTEWTTLLDFNGYARGIPFAFLQTAGYIILFWALLRGMKKLPRTMAILWWMLIICFFLLLFGYMDLPNHAWGVMEMTVANFFLFFSYIVLGVLIIVWYEGRLRTFGIMLLLEALGLMVIPFISLALFLDERCYYSNFITVPITLGMIWVAGKLLLGSSVDSHQ